MKLFYSENSPFARVARVFVREKGLRDRVEEVLAELRSPENEILSHGPTGKAPALLTGTGHLLSETPVVCAYLDALAPARLLVPGDEALLETYGLGLAYMDSLAWRFRESRRPAEERSPDFLAYEKDRCRRCCDALEGLTDRISGDMTAAQIVVAVALDAADRFHPDDAWRDGRPKLAAWHEVFAARPSMIETRPPALDTAR